MKKILSFLMILEFLQVNAQLPSSCNVPDALKKYYDYDVAEMALSWLYSIKSPDTIFIDIPDWCKDTVWSGLAAIYNRNDLPAVDSIFNKFCFHDIEHLVCRQITIYVDTSYSWTSNWRNLQTSSGIPGLDSLLSKYGFTITAFDEERQIAFFSTTQIINELMLCDSLQSFQGITYASPHSLGGSGVYPYLAFSDTGQYKYYTFALGWGMANWHIWKFKVNPDCSIEIPEVNKWSEDPYPQPTNCNIMNIHESKIILDKLEIFPNPAHNDFTVNTIIHGDFFILDMNGRQLLKKKIHGSTDLIDISYLQSGIYLVMIIGENNVTVGKIFKN